MRLTFTTTPDSADTAADLLIHSLQRGDFDDDDFADAADRAATAFQTAFTNALNDKMSTEPQAHVSVEVEHFDEILAVLESDPAATTTLVPLLTAANTAFGALPPSEDSP